MSVHKFCHNCGKQTQPDWKACPYCQTSLGSLSATPPKPTPVPAAAGFTPFAAQADDDDDEYVDKLTHLNIRQTSLHVDIVKDRPIGETIGAAMAQGAHIPPNAENYKRDGVDPAKALEEYKREAGTLRND